MQRRRLIPGHFLAATLLLLIVTVLTSYLDSKYHFVNYEDRILGLVLLLVGGFLTDQATHLAQNDHSGLPLTKIERFMQKHRRLSTIAGVATLIIGVLIL